MLIVIEGIDGSGKTTQATLLYDALKRRGYKVMLLSEPTESIYGEKIRQKLRDGDYTPNELYELFVKDRKHHAKKIESLLNSNTIIIMDRYYISTIAYQGAQGIPISRILNDHENMPQPDIIIILDVDPETALKRLGRKKDTFERKHFLEEVRARYLKIPSILRTVLPTSKVFIIDANRPIESIHREILGLILRELEVQDYAPVEDRNNK